MLCHYTDDIKKRITPILFTSNWIKQNLDYSERFASFVFPPIDILERQERQFPMGRSMWSIKGYISTDTCSNRSKRSCLTIIYWFHNTNRKDSRRMVSTVQRWRSCINVSISRMVKCNSKYIFRQSFWISVRNIASIWWLLYQQNHWSQKKDISLPLIFEEYQYLNIQNYSSKCFNNL